MNGTDMWFLLGGAIAVIVGFISVATHEPSKAARVTDPLAWVAVTVVVIGFISLFAEGR